MALKTESKRSIIRKNGNMQVGRKRVKLKKKKNGPEGVLRGMIVIVLMVLSFALGALFNEFTSKPPKTDARLTYIEDVPVMTDYIPEGCRARPGDQREIKWIVIHETDNFSSGADAAAHSAFLFRFADAEQNIVSWHYTVDDHEIYHHIPDNETAYHAGDGMSEDGGNMNGIGIEMCVNSDGNYEQTLINTERLCARLLIEYELKPKALKKHQDFSPEKKVCPSKLIKNNRWDEFCQAVSKRYDELKQLQKDGETETGTSEQAAE